MKKWLFLYLTLFVWMAHAPARTIGTNYSPKLKVSPDIWRFRTEEQVRQLVRRFINNPRAMYYLMNTAAVRRMEVPAALEVRRLQMQAPSDPKRQIIYAYALFVSGGPGSRAYWNKNATNAALVSDYGIGLSWLRITDATKSKVLSPELQLMRAVTIVDDIIGMSREDPKILAEWKDALARLRRVVKMAPSWADAHFWYGQSTWLYHVALSGFAREANRPTHISHLLSMAERSLLRAQSLDPGLTGDCARILKAVYRDQNQKAKELKYLDIWLRYQPGYKREPRWLQRRATLVKELAAARQR